MASGPNYILLMYWPQIGINITRCWVNGYSITAAPAKSVTHVSF
jgi:hypothetical protein